jgi:hypothetical protein
MPIASDPSQAVKRAPSVSAPMNAVPLETAASCNIPEARRIITAVWSALKSREANTGINFQAETGKLKEALGLMRRQNHKVHVTRHAVTITEQHERTLYGMVKDGDDFHMTCAEIALELFGAPCHLGWVSSRIAQLRKAAK